MKYIKNAQMQFIEMEDSAAVFDPGSGETHVLNDIACEILQKCEELGFREEIVHYFCEHYEGDAAEIASDVEEMIRELSGKGILLEREDDR